jgi:hypothetical protein
MSGGDLIANIKLLEGPAKNLATRTIPKRKRWFETREHALLTMKVHTGNKPRIAGMLVPTPS